MWLCDRDKLHLSPQVAPTRRNTFTQLFIAPICMYLCVCVSVWLCVGLFSLSCIVIIMYSFNAKTIAAGSSSDLLPPLSHTHPGTVCPRMKDAEQRKEFLCS